MGSEGVATGEAVFNTSMTGYQEILTDPSYAGQVVVMTRAHIGTRLHAPQRGDVNTGATGGAAPGVRPKPSSGTAS